MSDAIWYYVDRAQQRLGPVTADALVAAWHAGDASDASLVWREGMSDWRPLAEYRGELGLGAAAPVDLPPPAPAPGPGPLPAGAPIGATPAPAKSNTGCLIVGIVAVIGLIAVIGIIAAIALPAYNDYVERAEEAVEAMESGDTGEVTSEENEAQGYVDVDGDEDAGETPFSAGSASVTAALAEGRAHQALLDDFFANTERCPRDAGELALPAPATPGVSGFAVGVAGTRMCTITIEFGGAEAGALDGERIVLSRDGAGDWYCTSDMTDRSQLPSDCY